VVVASLLADKPGVIAFLQETLSPQSKIVADDNGEIIGAIF
jgi:hypothetical protein